MPLTPEQRQEIRDTIAGNDSLTEYYVRSKWALMGTEKAGEAFASNAVELKKGDIPKTISAVGEVIEAFPVIGKTGGLLFKGVGFLAHKSQEAKTSRELENVVRLNPNLDSKAWNQMVEDTLLTILSDPAKQDEIKRTAVGKPDRPTEYFSALFRFDQEQDVTALAIRDSSEITRKLLSGDIKVKNKLDGIVDEKDRSAVVGILSDVVKRPTLNTEHASAKTLMSPQQIIEQHQESENGGHHTHHLQDILDKQKANAARPRSAGF